MSSFGTRQACSIEATTSPPASAKCLCHNAKRACPDAIRWRALMSSRARDAKPFTLRALCCREHARAMISIVRMHPAPAHAVARIPFHQPFNNLRHNSVNRARANKFRDNSVNRARINER
eukprot:4605001-Pleurochrysis_carterae.AAC.1